MKYLTVLMIGVLLMCCNVKSNSRTDIPDDSWWDFWQDGMHYMGKNYYNGGAIIVNITKDSLECEYYKKQLNNK